MGNCFIKRKNILSERLQADILYLYKENLRTHDYILGELEMVKAMINDNRRETTVEKYRKISAV